MSEWQNVLKFLYGSDFWYCDPLREVDGLSEDQLFWTPDPKGLCVLWQVGHIAHRERTHIGGFLQWLDGVIIPPPYEVFGPDWHSTEEIRQAVPSVEAVFAWVREVRQQSREYVESLTERDLKQIPATSPGGLSVAQWLSITAVHTGLHIGKIQLLRSLVEGTMDRPC
jgi:hypothetical protein